MKTTTILLLILFHTAVNATEIYRWRDAQGKIHYSDVAPTIDQASELKQPRLPLLNSQAPSAQHAVPRASSKRDTRPTNSPTVVSTRRGKASLDDCIKNKRRAVKAARGEPLSGAKELDSWLWRNCRDFAPELRRISQEMM